MKRRLRTPTCGAARPTPSARSIVSYMPCTSGDEIAVDLVDVAARAASARDRRRAAAGNRTWAPGYPTAVPRTIRSGGAIADGSDPTGVDVDPQAARARARPRRGRREGVAEVVDGRGADERALAVRRPGRAR